MTLRDNQIRRPARAAFWGLLALVAAGCEGGAQPMPLAPAELLHMTSDAVGYDTQSFLWNTEGIKSAQVFADSAFYFNDSSAVHMRGVRMEVFTDQGAVRATVTADKGRYDSATQGMHATGNVILVMPGEDRRVESGELYYEPVDERIWSDSASVYTTQGRVTRGTCFKSNLEFTNLSVCNIRGSADVAP